MSKFSQLQHIVAEESGLELFETIIDAIGIEGSVEPASDKYFVKGYTGKVSLRLVTKEGAQSVLLASTQVSDDVLQAKTAQELEEVFAKIHATGAIWRESYDAFDVRSQQYVARTGFKIGYQNVRVGIGSKLTAKVVAEVNAKATKKRSFADLLGL